MSELDRLPVPVITLDAETVVTYANPAAGALVGVDPKQLVGLTCFAALRPRALSGQDLLRDGFGPAAKLPSSRRFPEQEVVVKKADGTEVEVFVEGGYEHDAGGALKAATLLVRAKHKGARRPRSGVRIVSAVSHELRSPLTSMRGYTSLLLKQWDVVPDEDRKAMLLQVDRDARRVSRMINELLDISRIETGRVHLNRREIDLRSAAAEVVHNVEQTYPDLEAELDFPDDMPSVWADPDKVHQVLTNLIENACKYATPKGLHVCGYQEDGNVVVEVRDRGPGIPEADLPFLFQQFFRSREGRPTGTGLGLWISRGLIEAHNGTLSAEPGEDEGMVFRFTLPLRAFEKMHLEFPERRL